jgi:hypothetical protein
MWAAFRGVPLLLRKGFALAVILTVQSGCSTRLDWSAFLSTDAFSVSSLSPNVGPLSGSLQVTIYGSGFTPLINTATLGGVACSPVSYVSSTEINCIIGANTAGTVDLKLMDATGTTVTIPGPQTAVLLPAEL